MESGNTTRVLLWLADTSLVKKQLEGKFLYYVADAVTGQPIEKADVEFFGWKQTYIQPNSWKVETTALSRKSDGDGQVILTAAEMPASFNWMIVARKAGEAEPPAKQGAGQGRFAYMGFSGVWYNRLHDPEYNQIKVLTMTDRPVYRPEHKVQFKAWVRHAKYDQADSSEYANRTFNVIIRNPKGEKVYEKSLTTDAYAGLEGEWILPKDATLGTYAVQVDKQWTTGNFRVEEYKKPEFEVKVEAPKEPIRLGEKIEATIQARYYFGAPVTRAKVKYKVTRGSHDSHWYPRGAWDWFYGKGYWWFASDYPWYPGWGEWGCLRPIDRWWGGWHQDPPEIVLENEVEIGADGTVKVVIDTSAGQGTARQPGPQLRHHRRGRRRVAADHRRHGQRAGGAETVPGVRLGRSRPLSHRRHGQGRL